MQRLIIGLVIIGGLWAIGLAAFIANLPKPSANAPAEADGVVVYTGGGGARIAAAMSVFADGAGERLLISGVHPDTTRERLADFWHGAPDRFECCVDLGREARSTEGNAHESAGWAQMHEFKGLVLVTSDYHMPRAFLATKGQLPDAEITPFVVASGYLNEKGRPQSAEAWRNLAGEYTKYLAARLRSSLSFLGL